ncbi:DOMON-like domain-containing protein [Brevundimonas sp.]|uniref:DOMON-like domain-containing protein n=1 Tax=Brevundimonas sp. TaxID=1871086 RepID=UPI002737B3E2|nr:DOMON-like domain-containing protein [Brevundimonas sp.]MDP3803695.1 DOMON-like domain-containing protein [Brevundimonas sp.]
MQFERALVPCPDTVEPPAGRIDVEVDWEGRSWIHVVFRASGFSAGVVLPAAGGGRRDELWKHTCCEVFGRRGDGSYVEFNLSPSTAWAAYGFAGYRADMTNLNVADARITFVEAEDGFELTAILNWREWPHVEAIGLSAVIETTDGAKTYWALNHPSDKPDFHHPESFALKSPVLGKP